MKLQKLIPIMLLVIVCAQSALGFAVSRPYFEQRPLVLGPGESQEFSLTLQNMGDEGDITAVVSISDGGNIAEITDRSNEYLVKTKTASTKVNFKVTIPEDATPGQRFDIRVGITQKVEGELSSPFRLTTGYNVKIPVEVTNPNPIKEQPAVTEEPKISNTILIAAILVLVIIALVAMLGAKKGNSTTSAPKTKGAKASSSSKKTQKKQSAKKKRK